MVLEVYLRRMGAEKMPKVNGHAKNSVNRVTAMLTLGSSAFEGLGKVFACSCSLFREVFEPYYIKNESKKYQGCIPLTLSPRLEVF